MAGSVVPSPDGFRKMLDLPVDPESVLRDILLRDEFRDSPIQSLLDRINESIISAIDQAMSWIARHWPKFGPLPGGYELFWTILGFAFYATVLGLLITGLVILVQRVILPRLARKRTEDTETLQDSVDQGVCIAPSRDTAVTLARQGQYRAALILLFRFVLLQLHERGALKVHPSRTTREILAQVSANQPIREPLAEMTFKFNAVRYGGARCGKTDFDLFLGLAEQLTRGN